MPTGYLLKSARVAVGLEATQLAAKAKVNPSTIHRMESAGRRPVKAQAETLSRILTTLEREGVEILDDGIRLVGKRSR